MRACQVFHCKQISIAENSEEIKHLVLLQLVFCARHPDKSVRKLILISHPNHYGVGRIILKRSVGAQWISGRVLYSRPRGSGFEPYLHHCVVVHLSYLSTGSTQEDPPY